MRARAAVLRSFGAPLSIEDVEVPRLAEGQVLVEVEAAGVCGSDVHMWRGKDPRTPIPIILGHEGVGRVVELQGSHRDIHGDAVSPGDRVLWERGVVCGACHACAVLHEPALCSRRWVYGIHRSFSERPHLNGCYASHLVLHPATHLIPLGHVSDPAIYVAASCSGATAAHGFALSPAAIGDTVVVFGPGPLGAFSALLACAAGSEHIIVIGGTRSRLDLCARLGATATLDRTHTTQEERQEQVLDLTHGRGADLVVEASGSIAAAEEGLGLLRHGGALTLVGFGTPVGKMALSPFEMLVRKNARVQGVWVSDVRHTLSAISLVRQHEGALAGLVTHRLPLERATEALEKVERREAMKAVVSP